MWGKDQTGRSCPLGPSCPMFREKPHHETGLNQKLISLALYTLPQASPHVSSAGAHCIVGCDVVRKELVEFCEVEGQAWLF